MTANLDQGVNAFGDVFAGTAAIRNAAGPPFGSNRAPAEWAASLLDLAVHPAGIRGRNVLDVGCGYGLSTVALAAHLPSRITAFDNSLDMLDLFGATLLSDKGITGWLHKHGGRQALGELFDATVKDLEFMRSTWKVTGPAASNLQVYHADLLNLDAVASKPGFQSGFDGVLASNVLHWPVIVLKKRLEDQGALPEEAIVTATQQVLLPICRLMRRDSVIVIQMPDDFVDWGLEPEEDAAYFEKASLTNHPVFHWLHLKVATPILAEYGIPHTVPRRTGLWTLGRTLKEAFSPPGVAVEAVRARIFSRLPHLEFSLFGLPQLLGKYKMEAGAKSEAIRRITTAALAASRSDEGGLPDFSQSVTTVNFCVVLRKNY